MTIYNETKDLQNINVNKIFEIF